jgi:hypothetical protein
MLVQICTNGEERAKHAHNTRGGCSTSDGIVGLVAMHRTPVNHVTPMRCIPWDDVPSMAAARVQRKPVVG